MNGSTPEALVGGIPPPLARALHFTSRLEIESRPGFDRTILVTRENYSGLVGDYSLPEAERVACQLQRKHDRCNQSHGIGWLARTSGEREGYIGGDCAEKYFGARSQFGRDRAAARRQIDTDEFLARIAAWEADVSVPERLRVVLEQLHSLYWDSRKLLEQLPQEVTRKLRQMAKNGTTLVPIDLGRVEPADPERPNDKPRTTWRLDTAGTVSAVRASDIEALRAMGDRARAAQAAREQRGFSIASPIKLLREQVVALDALPIIEQEVRDAVTRWSEFWRTENLLEMTFLASDVAEQFNVVRVALSSDSTRRMTDIAAWSAARDRILAKNDGGPFRVP